MKSRLKQHKIRSFRLSDLTVNELRTWKDRVKRGQSWENFFKKLIQESKL